MRPRDTWTRSRSGAPIALLIVLLILVGCGRRVAGEAPTTPGLPITAIDAGIAVTLVGVDQLSDHLSLTFRVESREADGGPPILGFRGISPMDVNLAGASWTADHVDTLHPVVDSTTTPAAVIAYEDSLPLASLQGPSQSIMVTITTLRFNSSSADQPVQQVHGTWQFTFTPADLTQAPLRRLEPGLRANADGLTFILDSVESTGTQTVVTYHVDSVRPGRLEMPDLIAQTSDGSFTRPLRISQAGRQHVAIFGSLPSGATVTFALSPTLAEVSQPAELTFPVDGHALAASASGQLIPIGTTGRVGGDQLAVVDVARETNTFDIRVGNREPNHGGRVLLYMPGTAVTLSDNLGNSYHLSKASTNFSKSDPLTMWADGSSFTFAGQLSPNASQLTLHVQSYGYQLRGPWLLKLQMP